jgi:hypothetical protein
MSTLLARSIILVNIFKHGFVHSEYESATWVPAHLSLEDRLLLLASIQSSVQEVKKNEEQSKGRLGHQTVEDKHALKAR